MVEVTSRDTLYNGTKKIEDIPGEDIRERLCSNYYKCRGCPLKNVSVEISEEKICLFLALRIIYELNVWSEGLYRQADRMEYGISRDDYIISFVRNISEKVKEEIKDFHGGSGGPGIRSPSARF